MYKLSDIQKRFPALAPPIEDKSMLLFNTKTPEDQAAIEDYLDEHEIPYTKKSTAEKDECNYHIHKKFFEIDGPTVRMQQENATRAENSSLDAPKTRPSDPASTPKPNYEKNILEQLAQDQARLKSFLATSKNKYKSYQAPCIPRTISPSLGQPSTGKIRPVLRRKKTSYQEKNNDKLEKYIIKSHSPPFQMGEEGFFLDMTYNVTKQQLIITNVHNYLDRDTYEINTTDFILHQLSNGGQRQVPLKLIAHKSVINSPVFLDIMQKGPGDVSQEKIREYAGQGGNNISMTMSLLSKAWYATREELADTMTVQVQGGFTLVCGVNPEKILALREEKRAEDLNDSKDDEIPKPGF